MRRAFCFAAGFVLALCVLLTAVLVPALSTSRFERALVQTVNQQALGVSESDLSAFAEETMNYLKGQKPEWRPHIPYQGVPESFVMHMHEVRAWIAAAPWVIGIGMLTAIVLLMLGRRQRKPVMLGMCTLIGLIVCVLLWSAVDFHSLWMILHKAFIPNGIFAYNEPVMQLFPLKLFFSYVIPVSLWAAGLLTGLGGILCVVTHR